MASVRADQTVPAEALEHAIGVNGRHAECVRKLLLCERHVEVVVSHEVSSAQALK